MRTHRLTNTLAALALFATASVHVAAAQTPEDDDYPGMMGPGMTGPGMMGGYYGMPHGMGMMGPGMMGPGMGMMGAFYALDLNDDQRKKLRQIQDGLRKQHWELMGKVQDEYAKLRDLYAADTRDPAAIGAQAQRIFDLRRQMLESSVEAGNRMEAVLTAEQKAQLRKDVRGGCPMW